MATVVNYETNALGTAATSVGVTMSPAPTAGNSLVAVHRYSTNVTNMTPPSGFTTAFTQAATGATFMHTTVSYKATATGSESAISASTGGASVFQELIVFEIAGHIDTVLQTIGAGINTTVTTTTVGPGASIPAGDKFHVGAVGCNVAQTSWGSTPSGYLDIHNGTNERTRVFYKATMPAGTVSYTQSWGTTAAYGAALVTFGLTQATASYILSTTYATDTDGIETRSFRIDATASSGDTTLTQTSGTAATVSEGTPDIYTFPNPSGDDPLVFELVSGNSMPMSITIPRKYSRKVRLRYYGGSVSDLDNWG